MAVLVAVLVAVLAPAQEGGDPLPGDAVELGDAVDAHVLVLQRVRLGPAPPPTGGRERRHRDADLLDDERPLLVRHDVEPGPPLRPLSLQLEGPGPGTLQLADDDV